MAAQKIKRKVTKTMLIKKEMKRSLIKKGYIICSIIIAYISSMYLWYWNLSSGWTEKYSGVTTLVIVGTLYAATYWFLAKMYKASQIGIYRLTELMLFQALSYGIADAFLLGESIIWFHSFNIFDIRAVFVVFIAQTLLSMICIMMCNRIYERYDEPRKVMIVYGNDNYESFVKKLLSKNYRYNIVACHKDDENIVGVKDSVDQCSAVYLYDVNPEMKKALVYYCKANNKNIYITQNIEELIIRGFDVSHTFDTPFVRTKRMPAKWYYQIMKRLIDVVCSALALVVLSPVFLMVALLIKAEDGGPVFYKQVRLTKNHREFEIYKFRSMVVDAEKRGAQLSTINDDRITFVGRFIRKTRIDELPQLINILKGDMSIIGPRPERPEIEKEYVKELPEFAFRLEVPAGLSGYAQVFGKYNTNPSDKLKLDLLYINQRSLLLDIKLMLYTIKVIFLPESTEGVESISGNAEIGVTNDYTGNEAESICYNAGV